MPTPSDIYPCLTYSNAPAAIDWLCRVFGFTKQLVVEGPNGTVRHSELSLGTGVIMVCSPRPDETRLGPSPNGINLQSLSAYVSDPDVHHEHAAAAGARIVQPPHDTEFGARLYVAEDLEGYHWCFGNYRPGQYWQKIQD